MRIRSSASPAPLPRDTRVAAAVDPAAAGSLHPGLIAAFSVDAPIALQMRALRAAIQQSSVAKPRGAIASCALIGLDCAEDVELLAGNLAIVTAQLGTETLLVDADFEQPIQHELFGLANTGGLINHLDGSAEQLMAQPTAVPGLMVMPVGTQVGGTGHLLEREALLNVLVPLSIRSSQLLVAIPLGEKQECRSIAHLLRGFDCAVLVTKKNRTTLARLRQMIDAMDESSVPMAGTLIL